MKAENCVICGTEMVSKVSFKGKGRYGAKRERWECPYCGYSTIKETYHEAMTREGKDQEESEIKFAD